ncbi:DUF1524 domain-containing protein [Nocardioides sp. GY 10113]|nr:DUF1524 domain-containing protein [Nocardioides sp. GY 10113]
MVLCLVPGFWLLWKRPGLSVAWKSLWTVVTLAAVFAIGLTGSETTVTGDPATSASSSPTPTPVETSSATPTEDPTPTPTTATPTLTPTEAPADGDADDVVDALVVKGRAAKTGYSRDQFGPDWVDVDQNGCDTRTDMLVATLTEQTKDGRCKVMSGTLADPYTGTSIQYVRGGTSEVDIDHVVALSDAWQKGAAKWPYAKRVAFANDPLNLQPADASANRQKGDSDAASWLPPNKSYRCEYVARQAAVKTKYRVWVTQPEKQAMLTVLETCPADNVPEPGSQPTIAANTGGPPPSATPKPTPKPTPSASQTDPRFSYCYEANDAGYGNYVRGRDPEYDWYDDRDGDGVVCEF